MPFEMFRTHTQPVNLADLEPRFESGASVDLAALKAAGLATRRDIPVKVLGRGELTKPLTVHAHALLQVRPRGHRGRRRHLPGHRVAPRSPSRAGDDPELLQGRGDPQEAAVHGGDPRALPARLVHPGAGRLDRGARAARGQLRRLGHPRLPQPVHGRRAVADRDLRARDHAVHHGLDHPAAPDGGLAVAGEAVQGGRGRPGAHHAVHALPDRRARRRAGRRLRLPLPLAGQQRRLAGVRELQRRLGRPRRASASPPAACC